VEPGDDGNPSLLPRRAYLCRLANSLARRNEPIVAVLDALHKLDDPSVPEGLHFLLRHVQGRFRLLAATRTAVPLALYRGRLSLNPWIKRVGDIRIGVEMQ
jgi:LuxR family maltose regulon positive regulatory protein